MPPTALRRAEMTRAAVAGALVALGLLASAGAVAGQEDHGGAGVGGPAVDPSPEPRAIAVTDKGVVPAVAVVAPGTEVVWRNEGRSLHTVTETGGRWESGTLTSGLRFTINAPAESGDYRYYCRFHPSIRGVLTVSPLELHGPAAVAFGTRAGLVGAVPGAAPETPVVIERRLPGRWEPVAEVVTAADGSFGASTPPLERGGAFRAVAGTAVSPSLRIGVRAAGRRRARAGRAAGAGAARARRRRRGPGAPEPRALHLGPGRARPADRRSHGAAAAARARRVPRARAAGGPPAVRGGLPAGRAPAGRLP